MSKKNKIPGAPDISGTNNSALDLQQDQIESAIEELNDLGDTSGNLVVSGRIYRFISAQDATGRPSFEFVGKLDRIVDEDFIGSNFGGGRYKLRYRVKTPRGIVPKDVIYNIGSNYDKFIKKDSPEAVAPAPVAANAEASKGFINSILGSLTPEKITVIEMAVRACRKIFAPPPPPPAPDVLQIIQAVTALTNNNKPSFSDAVVIKAMDNLNAQQQAAARASSPLQQFKEFMQLKDAITSGETENQNGGNDMEMVIKMAMAILPELLKKHNGNYKAVGAEAAASPYVKNLIGNDPGLAKVFFEKAVAKFGTQKAAELAAGFGYNIQQAPATVPVQVPPGFAPANVNNLADDLEAVGDGDGDGEESAEDPGEFDAATDEAGEV